jgi:hypothetical protein
MKGACLALKQRPIDSLTDDDKVRYILDAVYNSALAFALEQGSWNFAQRTVAVESSNDIEPSFGFSHVFEKPDDWLNSVALSATGSFWPPLGRNEYVDEGTNIHANCDPLYLSYISSDTEYGGDLSLWTATFERYFEFELAERAGPHLTTMSDDDIDRLEKKKLRALVNAKAKDAKNQAAQALPPGRLVVARRGSSKVSLQRDG